MISLKNKIVTNKDNIAKFREFFDKGRILILRAPCGFGKTTLADYMIGNRFERVLKMSGDKISDKLDKPDKWDVLYIDDMQYMSSENEQMRLCTVIRENPLKRFLLLTRGAVPGWLMPFRLSGLMHEISAEDMFFDCETTAKFFEKSSIETTDDVKNAVMTDTQGYPLAVAIVAEHLKKGEQYDSRLLGELTHEIYMYYDEMIYRRFDLPTRRFLLELAPFEKITAELAKMVSGDLNAGKMLTRLQNDSSMMIYDTPDTFHFWSVFRDFLMWEQNREYTEEQRRALYSRCGLFYELRQDYGEALECYVKSGESSKVSELLIKTTGLHPGMGHYEEMESYYMSLPDSSIEASPALMQGKSMLCALHADYEGSERWYNRLKDFVLVRKGTDAAAKEAKSRLIWLDVALPQRGVAGLIETIKSAFHLMANKEIDLPSFSVTSTLPSIMNGGKDFSDWSKIDDILYATMKLPVTAILGKDGTVLPECAITESKFEKGEDVSSKILTLVSRLSEVQSNGTPDIEFALVGLLVRSQIASGRADDAKITLTAMRDRFEQRGLERFMPNIDAMMCRIDMRCCDIMAVEKWFRTKAPRDSVNMRTLKRYQYFTEAMAELTFGSEDAALLTMSPLEPYCEKCSRHIDMIHLRTLTAIAKQRCGDAAWIEDMKCAVGIAAQYGFVQTISTYGAAVLPLIAECDQTPFVKKVTKSARVQAVYYPDFLRAKKSDAEKLTETETQVLRLICADKSNSEIGEILGIRLATVKSHVSHILQKLGASRRSEAKTVAEKLHIV